MGKCSKPEVVGLLIQKGSNGQSQRITSFNVQLGREGRGSNHPGKGKTIDLLVVVVLSVFLPALSQVEEIYPEIRRVVLDGVVGSLDRGSGGRNTGGEEAGVGAQGCVGEQADF
jgi:hypothetical protein